jgi:PST family polysaccharide transporter
MADDDSRHVKGKLASASLWSLVSGFGAQSSSFVIFVVLARLLQPSDFGVVAFAAIFIDLSRGVMLGGIPEALIQRKTWNEVAANTAFWVNMAAATAITAVICGICLGVRSTGLGEVTPLVVAALSTSLLIDAFRAVQEARLRREFRYKSLAQRTVLANVGGGVCGVAYAFMGGGVWALVVQRLATSCFQTIIVWMAAPFKPSLHASRSEAKVLLHFGSHVLINRLVGQMNGRLPEFIIGSIAGSAALGLYRVGSRSVNFLIQTLITPVQSIALSAFSRLQTPAAAGRAYRRFTQLCALLTFPAFAGLAIIADDFTQVVFGAKWAASAPIMAIICLAVFSTTIIQFFQPAMQGVGKPKAGVSTELVKLGSGAILVGGLAFLGPVAAAAGDTLRKYVTLPVAFRMLQRELAIKPRDLLKDLLPPFACSVSMLVTLFIVEKTLLVEASHLVRLVVNVLLGGLIYGVAMLVFASGFLREILKSMSNVVPPKFLRLIDRLIPSGRPFKSVGREPATAMSPKMQRKCNAP